MSLFCCVTFFPAFIHLLNTGKQNYQNYIDLELDVCPGSGSCQKGFNEENRVLYLLTYIAIGGVYHSYEQQSTSEILPSIIVKTNYRFGKRIEAIWTTLVGLPEDLTTQINNYQEFLDGLLGTVPILCYLNLMFDLLTTDEKVNRVSDVL